MAPRWTWATGPALAAGPDDNLSRIQSRTVTRRLQSGDIAAFAFNGRSPMLPTITELATDLWAYRDGALMFRGRIAPTDDEGDEKGSKVAGSALSYRTLAAARNTEPADTLSFAGTDIAQIAWSLINGAQGRPGGALGITRSTTGFTGGGVANTGVVADRNYEPDKLIGTLVDQLMAAKGADWDVLPDRTLAVWGTGRGKSIGTLLQFPGNVGKWKRSFAYASFANAGAASGSAATSPERVNTAGLGTDPRGRWEFRTSYSSVVVQSTVAEHAAADLAERSTPAFMWTLQYRPGAWGGPDELDVGDLVTVAVTSPPRITVPVPGRVLELSVAVDANGVEQVTVKVEQIA